MKIAIILCINFMLLACICLGQKATAKLKFCGYKYKDSGMVRRHFEKQLDFLNINDKDTIVDIGSSSGAYIGAINVIAGFKNVHFILVDIDSNCLNTSKVNSMIAHYENLRTKPFDNSIAFVNNTVDSLYLPPYRFKKLWIFNTLHEIPDKVAIIKQMAAVMQSGGELIIAELMATERHTMHDGCHQPLMSEAEIKQLMAAAGFAYKDVLINPVPLKKIRNPYYLFRFIKL